MRKRTTFIVTLFILLAIFAGLRFTFLALRNSEGNKKGPPVQCYSSSIEESKKNDVFKFETNVNKPGFVLDNSLKCEIKNSWVEERHIRQPLMFGTSPITKFDNRYQLIIAINIESASKKNIEYFYFAGNQPLDTLVHFYCKSDHSLDTIKVPIYRSPTDQFSIQKERKALDTLIFTQKQTKH